MRTFDESSASNAGDALRFDPRNDYYFRLLLAAAGIGTLAMATQWNRLTGEHVLCVLWLIYPHIVLKLANCWPVERSRQLISYAGFIDATLVGLTIGFIDFQLLPTFMFVTVIQAQALMHGGIKTWVHALGFVLLGFILSLLVHTQAWQLQGTIASSIPSLIGVSLYFGMLSFFMNRHMNALDQQVITREQEFSDLRMKTWKLSRYVSPQIWHTVFAGQEVKLETHRKRLTVFFSDIKGFTELSESMEAEDMTDMLNHYLSEMAKIVHKHGGTIDKFIGDAIMVFYGDPTSKGAKADCLACVSMAIEMKKHMRILQQRWMDQGIETPLEIRMGINTGYCTVGNFGTEQRLDYTVLGTEVNLASRLETAAPPGEILISHETYSLIKDSIYCEERGTVTVKGFNHPIRVYSAVDFRKNMGATQAYFEQRADGFSMYLDLDKVKNYDQERVLKSLLTAATRLKNKFNS